MRAMLAPRGPPRYGCGMRASWPRCKSAVTAWLLTGSFSLLASAALAQDAPADDATRAADLLAQLAEAEDPVAAGRIEVALDAIWSRSGSATVDLLLQRGRDALEAGDAVLAAEHFTAAIDAAPDFAEAYAGRASAYYLAGETGPAVADLATTLRLNPDHIQARVGLAYLLEETEDRDAALEVWRQVAEMSPTNAQAADAIARLTAEIEGTTL